MLGQTLEVRAPGLELVGPHVRLAQVVEHEALRGAALDQLDRCGQLTRMDQQVVGQVELREQAQAAPEVGAQQEGVVGLVLGDVAQAHQARVVLEALELTARIARRQVHPADHTGDRVVCIGEFEQPGRFHKARARLHGHAAVQPMLLQERRQVARQEVALQYAHTRTDPGVLLGRVAPEVLVGIDAHGRPGYLGPSRATGSRAVRPTRVAAPSSRR